MEIRDTALTLVTMIHLSCDHGVVTCCYHRVMTRSVKKRFDFWHKMHKTPHIFLFRRRPMAFFSLWTMKLVLDSFLWVGNDSILGIDIPAMKAHSLISSWSPLIENSSPSSLSFVPPFLSSLFPSQFSPRHLSPKLPAQFSVVKHHELLFFLEAPTFPLQKRFVFFAHTSHTGQSNLWVNRGGWAKGNAVLLKDTSAGCCVAATAAGYPCSIVGWFPWWRSHCGANTWPPPKYDSLPSTVLKWLM